MVYLTVTYMLPHDIYMSQSYLHETKCKVLNDELSKNSYFPLIKL